jgi:two-component system, LytTR family, response regulator
MIKALIVDDELHARDVLDNMLAAYCPQVMVIGKADSVEAAHQLIQKNKPDLVFLDIEMQGETGFELLERFPTPFFKVIFVTAYDHYAIKAIKLSALDYILKPISEADLLAAVDKADEQINTNNQLGKLQNLLTTLRNPKDMRNKIVVNSQIGTELIEIEDIVRCEASGSYTVLYLKNQRSIMSSKNLKSFQALLEDYQFFRVHDSHLIGYKYINKVLNDEGGMVLTSTNERIPISRRRKNDFQDWLLQIN